MVVLPFMFEHYFPHFLIGKLAIAMLTIGNCIIISLQSIVSFLRENELVNFIEMKHRNVVIARAVDLLH